MALPNFLRRWFGPPLCVVGVNASVAAAQAAEGRLPPPVRRRLARTSQRTYLVAASGAIDAAEDGAPATYNVFATLPGLAPDVIVVGREQRLLLDDAFSRAWLAYWCTRLESAGELWLEAPREQANAPDSPRLRPHPHLGAATDVFNVADCGDGWYRVTPTREFRQRALQNGVDDALAQCFQTALPGLLGGWEDFRTRYSDAHAGYIDGDRLKPEFAARQYIYTLHGMSQKSCFLEWAAARHGRQAPLRVLDMGGGYGAMGVELASHGHQVTLVELEAAKVEYVGDWLARQSAVGERVTFRIGDFDTIDNVAGPFDVISFFGSLLYYPHAHTVHLLQRCRERLAPGGLLVIHENPRERADVDALDYDNQFPAAELDRSVRAVFDHVDYFAIADYRKIDLAEATQSLMLVVATAGQESDG